jgi:hypothetical protein
MKHDRARQAPLPTQERRPPSSLGRARRVKVTAGRRQQRATSPVPAEDSSSRVRGCFPKGIDREGTQAVPEREGLLPGIEHVSGHQPRAQSLGEVAQVGQVLGANGRSGLHLDGDCGSRGKTRMVVD